MGINASFALQIDASDRRIGPTTPMPYLIQMLLCTVCGCAVAGFRAALEAAVCVCSSLKTWSQTLSDTRHSPSATKSIRVGQQQSAVIAFFRLMGISPMHRKPSGAKSLLYTSDMIK